MSIVVLYSFFFGGRRETRESREVLRSSRASLTVLCFFLEGCILSRSGTQLLGPLRPLMRSPGELVTGTHGPFRSGTVHQSRPSIPEEKDAPRGFGGSLQLFHDLKKQAFLELGNSYGHANNSLFACSIEWLSFSLDKPAQTV